MNMFNFHIVVEEEYASDLNFRKSKGGVVGDWWWMPYAGGQSDGNGSWKRNRNWTGGCEGKAVTWDTFVRASKFLIVSHSLLLQPC
ncbi:hypothetical protein Tco_1384669 [Tanacetum coccineum]